MKTNLHALANETELKVEIIEGDLTPTLLETLAMEKDALRITLPLKLEREDFSQREIYFRILSRQLKASVRKQNRQTA
jgi:hypothetical protein